MRIYVDDVRKPPEADMLWVKTVKDALFFIALAHGSPDEIIYIDLDHDAGDFVQYGGDYIEILNYLEEHQIPDDRYQFHVHSMNPVGIQNMRAIFRKNNWIEI